MGFFLLAPVFGMLAALVLILDPGALSSRWQPGMLAFTHLLTLGFGAQVVVGALFQVLPVISNQAIPAGATLAPWIRAALGLGAFSLALGFISANGWLFALALGLLGAALGTFGAALALGVSRIRPWRDSSRGVALALVALITTLVLGAVQASPRFAPELGLYRLQQTDLHALWGGLGWCLLLIMAVSYQVIPMFHVAPAFPARAAQWLPSALFVALLTTSLAEAGALENLALGVGLLLCLLYGATALYILSRRKRKLVDYTVRFWQLGLVHLLAVSLLGLYGLGTGGTVDSRWMGLAWGLGFVGSVMLGMLQKILPFLIYLHLQRAWMKNPMSSAALPNMKSLIPTPASRRQWQFHLSALGGLYGALVWPVLTPLAGALLFADFAWLTRCLHQAHGRYQTTLDSMTAAGEPAPCNNGDR
nr:NnrS family protein [Motiliproteus sp. SC1-56]